MLQRRPGAPRLIDWTGERAVPWAPDVNVIYEHYHRYLWHRYLWAQTLVAGRRVLDVGSGEGYGSALLAASADSVVGVEVDQQAVEHSVVTYASRNLSFEVASATDLNNHTDASFDAVVAFGILEHVEDQASMLREINRVLSEDGLVVMSTPDRRARTEATETENTSHAHELSEEEFRELLGEHFTNVCLFGQRAANGSRIESLDEVEPAPGPSFILERHGDEWLRGGAMSPCYLIAVASRSALPTLAPDSTLSDYDPALLRSADRDRLDADLEAATRDISSLELELALMRKELAAACIEESRLNQSEAKVSAMSVELAACRKATGRPDDPRPLDQVIVGLRKQAEGFTRIRGSRSYVIISRYRQMLGRIAPAGTRRRSAYRLLTKGRRRS